MDPKEPLKCVYLVGRDDIIVKVNLQSLIPSSFSH